MKTIINAVLAILSLLFPLFLSLPVHASTIESRTQIYSTTISWMNRGMAMDKEGKIYALRTYNNLNGDVRVHDMLTGTFLFSFSRGGSIDGYINTARGVAIDPQGYVWISDSGNNRIQKFMAVKKKESEQ